MPSFAAGPSSSTTTTTKKTTTSGKVGPLYIQGHSPVDMLLVYQGPSGTQEIGCASEPCSVIPFKGIVNTFSFSDDALFIGPSGAGCEQEYPLKIGGVMVGVPETISFLNAPAGTYEIELLPSSTYYASTGPGCHLPPAPPSDSYSLDACFSLTTSGMCESPTSIGGGCVSSATTATSSSCPLSPVTISVSQGQVTVIQSSGVPEFPFSGIVSLITLAVIVFVVVRLILVSRKGWTKMGVGFGRNLPN